MYMVSFKHLYIKFPCSFRILVSVGVHAVVVHVRPPGCKFMGLGGRKTACCTLVVVVVLHNHPAPLMTHLVSEHLSVFRP